MQRKKPEKKKPRRGAYKFDSGHEAESVGACGMAQWEPKPAKQSNKRNDTEYRRPVKWECARGDDAGQR